MKNQLIFGDYIIIPEQNRFNLYIKRTGKKKETGEEFESITNIGYSYTFGRALHEIAIREAFNINTVELIANFINEYEKITDRLLKHKWDGTKRE